MKNIFILVSFINMNIAGAQKQMVDYALVYEFEYVTDTISRTYSNPEEYILYNVQNSSYFLNRNEYYNDSLVHSFENKMGPKYYNDPIKFAKFQKEVLDKTKKIKSNYRLVKNFKERYSQIILTTFPGRSKYMEFPMILNWSTQIGSDTIAGIPCKKATTSYGGRDYICWYSTSIPISDGPYIFDGLPGLIIKVTDSKNSYKFVLKKMKLEPTKQFVQKNFMNQYVQTKISREEFVQNCKKMKENPQFPSGMLNVSPEMILNLKERYKERFDLLLEQNN